MHDCEASDWLRPGVVRAHLLAELRLLPPDEHLLALAAVDRHDVEIVLTNSSTITVVVGDRWQLTMPVRDVVIDTDDRAEADADG